MQAPIVEITMPEDDRWHPGEKFGLGADGKILCYSEERKKWRKSIYGHGEDFADGMGPVQRLVVALVEQLRQSKEENADLKRSRGMIDADAKDKHALRSIYRDLEARLAGAEALRTPVGCTPPGVFYNGFHSGLVVALEILERELGKGGGR